MKRVATQWRPNWQAAVESQGFPFHTNGQRPSGDAGTYWFEGAYYELSAADVDCLESATLELHRICLLAAERLAHDPKTTARMGIPSAYQELAAQSWSREDPTIYGRIDLAWDGNSSPKLLEYNADTRQLSSRRASCNGSGCKIRGRTPTSSTRCMKSSSINGGPSSR